MPLRKLLWSYMKESYRRWLCYYGSAGAVILVESLYRMRDTPGRLSYALVILFFFWLCGVSYGFARYVKKHEALERACRNPEAWIDCLPPARGLSEELYQELLLKLAEEKRTLVSELDARQQDMSDYYSMWAHQIKTPLAALRLLVQRQEDGAARAMREELFKTEQYVEMALHYVRLESGADLLFREYDLAMLIGQSVRKYALLFIGRGLSLDLEEINCRAVTDEKWFSFLFEQLLSNAIKYTKKGSIRISGPAGNTIRIEDTGIGIPECDLPRIFERGFTGYNGRMHKKSTGIGLYLCRQAADKLGIGITVEAAVNRGTSVTLLLPSNKGMEP